jgi:hypothetical protein
LSDVLVQDLYPPNAFIRGILLFVSWFAFFYILVGLVCFGVAWYASRWRNLSASMSLVWKKRTLKNSVFL